MKLFRVVLVAIAVLLSTESYSQKISFSVKNTGLEKVLKLIEQQTSYKFVYTNEAMALSKPVSIEVKNESLVNVLKSCFANQTLSYSIEDNLVIVKVVEEKSKLPAPSYEIHGVVTNESGEPLNGATVKIKETQIGTSANDKGEFVLTNVTNNSTIIITSVGYEKLEIPLQGRISIRAELKTAVNNLDETLVIAYGKTTQRYNTGSVSKVSGTVISKQPVTNPLAALEGRVPGLVVTQSNGVPGSLIKVQLRGQNSLVQGSEPLFVIDGVPFAPNNTAVNQLNSAAANFAGAGLSPFNSINPSDIESIEILKDADATAIYGSRGANGVILITTKKGKAGKTRLTVNTYTGFSNVTRTVDMLNTEQYLQMRHEAFVNDSVSPTVTNAPDLLLWDTTRYTDFKKLLIGGTAHTADVQASLSGGSSNTQFLLSANYHRETTVYPGDLADNRGSVNLNLSHISANQKFSIILSAIYSSDKNAINTADLTRYINLAPDAPALYDSSGKLNWQQNGVIFTNPLAFLLQKYTAQTDNLLSNFLMSYHILPSLTVKTSAGYNTYDLNEVSTNPIASQNPAYNPRGYSEFAHNAFKSWIIEPQAEYIKKFGRFSFDALIGGTLQKVLNNYSSLSADGYTNDALLASISGASSVTVDADDATDYRYAAFFGRLNINYNNRYVLNLSGRRDGSSRFGPQKQLANFSAFGGAWIFSNEKFIKNSFSFLSYGKLRGSYGSTGNDQIGDYQFLNTWSPSNYSYQHIHGLYPTRLFNPDYSWEINRKAEGAIELGFLKDRIVITASYFVNRSTNELVQYQLPLQTGFSSVLSNFPAVVQNKGAELSFTGKNIETNYFSWATTITLTIPHNKLVAFPGLSTSTYANKYVVGSSVNIIKGYQFLGVDPATGVFEFNDVNKDSKLDSKDFVVLGDLDAQYYGGFLNSVKYKQFEADIFFEFKKQTGRNFFSSIYNPYVYPPGAMGNQPTDVLERWQKPGDITGIEKFTSTYGTSAFNALNYLGSSGAVYGDASFIRLKNVSMSYSFPTIWLKKYKIENCRLYIQCQNLLTITSYQGTDPETQNFYALPPLRTITAGIHFTF